MVADDDIEFLQLKIAVAEALDAGRAAEDQLQTVSLTTQKPSRWNLLLGAIGVGNYLHHKAQTTPTQEQSRKMANALDEFARLFVVAADGLDDFSLRATAVESASWGPSIWENKQKPADVYHDLRAALGTLQRYQTQLFLNREGR